MQAQKLFMALALSTIFASIALPAATQAQSAADNFPSKPITVVVPFPPGGVTELEARLYAGKLSENLKGHPVPLDFKPGAGSTVGAAYVAKQAPDGHTLLVISGAFTISPQLYKDLPYDSIRDFAPVSLMSNRLTVMMAHPDKPYKNSREFIDYARANPGKVNFATSGAGGAVHLFGAYLESLAKVKFTFIHYNGSGPLMGDLFAGRVDVYPTTFSIAIPPIKSGKQRALALTSLERSPLFPGLPTFDEESVPGYEYSSWLGIAATGGTPAPIINRLGAEFAKVAKAPDLIARGERDGTKLIGSTPAAFTKHIGAELVRWQKVVREANIRLQEN